MDLRESNIHRLQEMHCSGKLSPYSPYLSSHWLECRRQCEPFGHVVENGFPGMAEQQCGRKSGLLIDIQSRAVMPSLTFMWERTKCLFCLSHYYLESLSPENKSISKIHIYKIPGPTFANFYCRRSMMRPKYLYFIKFPREIILMFQQFGEPLSCKWLKKAILEKVLNNK